MGFLDKIKTKANEIYSEKKVKYKQTQAANKIIKKKAHAEYLRSKEKAAIANANKRGSNVYKSSSKGKGGWDIVGGLSRLAGETPRTKTVVRRTRSKKQKPKPISLDFGRMF